MSREQALRALVTARAGGACEYSRLVELPTGVRFHLDHFIPLSAGGKSVLSNLALCCPGCILSKGDRTQGLDDGGETQSLFSPRQYEPSALGWHIHFAVDRATGLIIARTVVGQATARGLNMNATQRLYARLLQVRTGLIG